MLLGMQAALEDVTVEDSIGRYMVDLTAATREHSQVLVGASPRGSLALMLLSRAKAALAGRDYVIPEDVKQVAKPALAHRLTLQARGVAAPRRSVIGRRRHRGQDADPDQRCAAVLCNRAVLCDRATAIVDRAGRSRPLPPAAGLTPWRNSAVLACSGGRAIRVRRHDRRGSLPTRSSRRPFAIDLPDRGTDQPPEVDVTSGWVPTRAFGRMVLLTGFLLVLAVFLRRPDLVVLAAPLAIGAALGLWRRPQAAPAVRVTTPTPAVSEGARSQRLDDDHEPRSDPLRPGGRPAAAQPLAARSSTRGRPYATALAPGETVGIDLDGRALRWGRHTLGPTVAYAVAGDGLLISPAGVAPYADIRAFPNTDPFKANDSMPRAAGMIGFHRSRRPGEGGELAGVRPFSPGDRLRRIDWRVSLRTRELHVVATLSDRDAEVTILLDLLHESGMSGGVRRQPVGSGPHRTGGGRHRRALRHARRPRRTSSSTAGRVASCARRPAAGTTSPCWSGCSIRARPRMAREPTVYTFGAAQIKTNALTIVLTPLIDPRSRRRCSPGWPAAVGSSSPSTPCRRSNSRCSPAAARRGDWLRRRAVHGDGRPIVAARAVQHHRGVAGARRTGGGVGRRRQPRRGARPGGPDGVRTDDDAAMNAFLGALRGGIDIRVERAATVIEQATAGPVVLRATLVAAALAGFAVTWPIRDLLTTVLVLPIVLALGVGMAPRSFAPTATIIAMVLGYLVNIGGGASPDAWRPITAAGLIYVVHTGAAFAAVLPFNTVATPGLYLPFVHTDGGRDRDHRRRRLRHPGRTASRWRPSPGQCGRRRHGGDGGCCRLRRLPR